MAGPRTLRVVDLTASLTRYKELLAMQEALADKRKQDQLQDVILLVQVRQTWILLHPRAVRPACPLSPKLDALFVVVAPPCVYLGQAWRG